MMITLSRLYPDGAIARAVVDELKAAGLPEDDIGIIAPSRDNSLRMENADLENAGDVVDRDRDGADDRGQTVNRAPASAPRWAARRDCWPGLALLCCPASARWWRRAGWPARWRVPWRAARPAAWSAP